MNITIVAPYCSLPSEPHFNRFWYLAELLSQSHDVLLITSNFKHYDKSFRRPEDAEAASQGRLKVMLLEESGYSKNVSLGRVTSHHRFVKHFEKWLENCRPGEQDVVFSAYPLIATNLLLGKHKARLGYKLIVDVQDVWPESFSSVVPFLKKVPHNLLPFASRANQAYRYADALVAVSQTYLDRAKEANPNVPGEVVYIGTDFPKLDAAPAKDFGDDKTRFFYLGTLSYSYDVETVCKGVRKLLDAGENVELHIMGGGPDLDRLKQYACDGKVLRLHSLRRNDVGRQGLRHLRQRHPLLRHAVDYQQTFRLYGFAKTDSEQPGQRRSCRSPYPAAACELPFRRCGRFRSSSQRYSEAQKRSCSVRRNRPPLQTRRCLSKNRQPD